MSRDGGGVYSIPPGSVFVKGTSIDEVVMNALIADLEADLNFDRPVSAGGTGASTVSAAAANLGVMPAFDTRTLILSANIDLAIELVRTGGFSSAGDGGGGLYKRVGSQPSHDFKVQSADGAWWELVQNEGINLFQIGAVGDGVADDTTKIEAADAHGSDRIIVPEGTFVSTALPSTLGTRFEGVGHLKVNNQPRGRMFSYIDAEQTAATGTNFADQFDGDNKLSPIQIDVEYQDDVSNPFGSAGSTYVYRPEIIPVFAHLRIGAGVGFNSSTNQNGPGRTGAVIHRARLSHNGQGDAVCFNSSAFVNSTKAGSTHFLANPAAVLFNGDMSAGIDGAYLNCTEFRMSDSAGGTDWDVSAIGVVYNMVRNNDTGAKEAGWDGIRIQSSGTKEIHAGIRLTGKIKVGLDLSRMTSGNEAAIAVAQDHRIYFDAVNGGTTFGTTLGTTFITFDGTGIVSNVAGVSIAKVTATEWQLTPASGNPVVLRITAGGTQFAHMGLSGNVAYIGGGSTASDSVQLTLRTSSAGAEQNTASLLPNGAFDLLLATGEYRINGTRVMDARKTGWTTVPTGILTRTTFVAFAGQTISGTYQQSEIQAIDDALKANSERLAALIVDIHSHGAIGP